MKTRIVFASSILSLLLAAAAAAQAQIPQFHLVQVPAPPGGTNGIGVLDAGGNVVGSSKIGSRYEAVKWVGGTHPVIYPRLASDQNIPDKDYYAVAINSAGAVIGSTFQLSTVSRQGIYWDAGRHPLAVPLATDLSGISSGGVLAGIARDTAARWATPSSQPALLPYRSSYCPDPVADFCESWTSNISPNGKYIVGGEHAFDNTPVDGILWVNGVVASNYTGPNLDGAFVTDTGIVVGSLDTGIEGPGFPDISHAFRWEAGTLTDLGSLPGAPVGSAFYSSAAAINSSGIIVGNSQVNVSLEFHAVLWIDGQIMDLHAALASQVPPDVILTYANSINDKGEILLVGENQNTGERTAYIAKPLIPTHTSIRSNINPSTYGQQIHLVAKVMPDSGPVPTTGQVSWYDNGTLLGKAGVTDVGTSSWEPSTWNAGVHNVTAVFPASSTLGTSTSPVFKQTVNPAHTRTTVRALANPATKGQPVSLIATVVPTSGTIAGTVTFKSGTGVLGTSTLNPRTRQAWLTTTYKAAGSYSITVDYAGSQNFLPSGSSPLTLTVK